MKKKLLKILVILIAVTLIVFIPIRKADGQDVNATYEQQFVVMINDLRVSDGLAPLHVNKTLADSARVWAKSMQSVGKLSHDPNLGNAVDDWKLIGENVGTGPGVIPIFNAFVGSPAHYSNLVNPNFTEVGVGVVSNNGVIYTAQRFEQPFGAVPVPTQTIPPASTEAPATLAPTTSAAPTTEAPTTTNLVCRAT